MAPYDFHAFDAEPHQGSYSLEAVFLYEDADGFPEPGQSMLGRSGPTDIYLRPWKVTLGK